MKHIRFNHLLITQLSALEAVEKVTPKMIYFNQDFKLFAVKQRQKGSSSNQIFIDAGIDISIFPKEHFQKLLKRWSQEFRKLGDEAFKPKPKGKPKGWTKKIKKTEDMTPEEIKAKIAYLEAENNFLKKLKGLEPLD